MARSAHANEQAQLVHEHSLDLALSPALEAQVEALCAQLRNQGRRVERLPVYRVGAWETGPLGLSLAVGHTDYGVALAQRLRPEWWGATRLPTLAVCALTMCGEVAVVEHRSQRVAVSAGLIHVKPSGNLQPPEQPVDGLYREALEELGLGAEDLADCQLLGLTLCQEVLLDVVYRWECRRPLEVVLGQPAEDSWEHDRLETVDCRAEPLARWCRENYQQCSPPGHAALMLEGWRRYGLDWFEGVWACLS